MHILTIILTVICNVTAQTNFSPRSAATAQTFGTFTRGLAAVDWNAAILAYQYRITQEPNIQAITRIDTIYRLHILTATSEEKSVSITKNIKESLYLNIITCTARVRHHNESLLVKYHP